MAEKNSEFEEIILDDDTQDNPQDNVKVETPDGQDVDVEVQEENKEPTLSPEELAKHATGTSPVTPPSTPPTPPKEEDKKDGEDTVPPVGDKPNDPATAQLEFIRNTSIQNGVQRYLSENMGVVTGPEDVKSLMAMYHRIKPADLTDFDANEVYSTLKQAGMALFGERIIANQQKAFEVQNAKRGLTRGATVPIARQSNSSTNSVILSQKVINAIKENGEDPKEYAKFQKQMLDTGTISEQMYIRYTQQEYQS